MNVHGFQINEANGTVQVPYVNISFEAIEKLYKIIVPLLRERRRAELLEGENVSRTKGYGVGILYE